MCNILLDQKSRNPTTSFDITKFINFSSSYVAKPDHHPILSYTEQLKLYVSILHKLIGSYPMKPTLFLAKNNSFCY